MVMRAAFMLLGQNPGRQSVMQEESLQKVLTVRHRKFISQQAVQRQITGH